MTKVVAILDDRRTYADTVSTFFELEDASISVAKFYRIDDAITAVLEDGFHASAWIVDLMLPPGEILTSLDADSGIATGERFITECLELGRPNSPLVFVWSARTTLSFISPDDPNIVVMPKGEVTAVKLVKSVITTLGRAYD